MRSYCKIPMALSYAMLAYVIASVIYLIVSIPFGTPFKDALKDYPDLVKIQKESAEKRRNAFLIGLVVAVLIVWYIKPFRKCGRRR
jgi:hypothetical protein